MKTTVLEVGGMLSVLDHRGVEKRLKDMSGVKAASVNIATGDAVVEYEEALPTSNRSARRCINICGGLSATM
jgi:cation transport ATPase